MSWITGELKKLLQRSDLTAKLVCLLGAILLWAYVGSMKVATVKYRVPVEVRNLPANVVIAGNPDMFINVVLSGKKDEVKSVNLKNIKPYINLENAMPGKSRKYSVEYQKGDIPEGIEVDLSRKKIAIELERKLYRRVRIVPLVAWERHDGYVLGTAKVVPDYVIVTGGEKELARIRSIPTKRIIVEGVPQRTVKEVLIDTDAVHDVMVNSQRVSVTVSVLDVRGLSKLDVPVRIKNLGEQYQASAAAVKVVMYARVPADMTDFAQDKFDAYVDMGAVNMETLFGEDDEKEIEKLFPVIVAQKQKREGLKIVHLVPDEIVVRISIK